jgi:hypothetical protein
MARLAGGLRRAERSNNATQQRLDLLVRWVRYGHPYMSLRLSRWPQKRAPAA